MMRGTVLYKVSSPNPASPADCQSAFMEITGILVRELGGSLSPTGNIEGLAEFSVANLFGVAYAVQSAWSSSSLTTRGDNPCIYEIANSNGLLTLTKKTS